jgi:hypothetical protein
MDVSDVLEFVRAQQRHEHVDGDADRAGDIKGRDDHNQTRLSRVAYRPKTTNSPTPAPMNKKSMSDSQKFGSDVYAHRA